MNTTYLVREYCYVIQINYGCDRLIGDRRCRRFAS